MWFFVTLGAVCLITLAVGAYSLAPWLPSFERDFSRIFALGELKEGDVFYDLGSGDGRVVRAAAARGATAIGVEIGLPLYAWSELLQLVRREPRVSYRLSSFFSLPLHTADFVYVFGRPGKLGQKLTEKLKKELKPGARVVTYAFPLEDLSPVRVDKPNEKSLSLYLYRF